MRGVLTGIAIGLGIVALALLGGYLWLDHRASSLLAQRFDVPLEPITIPKDSASLVAGEQAAWLRGCHGCHDRQLQGKVFLDEPRVMRLVTPNIPETIAAYSDAELARLIRHGVRRDGTGILAMPIPAFYQLSDQDLANIIAHLRAAPVVHAQLPTTELRLMAKLGLVTGEVVVEAATIDHHSPRLGGRSDTTQLARGEYLAKTICAECHGEALLGEPPTPPLLRAMGYSAEQFTSLMLDGRARDGRDLGLMARTARSRFVRFKKEQIEAIYAYLMVMTVPAGAGARRTNATAP